MTHGRDAPLMDDTIREIAHELRNPLASILSSVELIQVLGQGDSDVSEQLESIDNKVHLMASVIDSFLSDAASDRAPGQAKAAAAPGNTDARQSHPLRILIVDDNFAAADSLAQILRLRGFEIEVAYGGAAGYKKALDFSPDAALLDLGMPEVDGYALAAMIRCANIDCALVALTGYADASDFARVKIAGFDARLTKPARTQDIVAAVHAAIDLRTKDTYKAIARPGPESGIS